MPEPTSFTYITWWIYAHGAVPQSEDRLSQVHVIQSEAPLTSADVKYRSFGKKLLCGKTIGFYTDPRKVSSFLRRPCKTCQNKLKKIQNV